MQRSSPDGADSETDEREKKLQESHDAFIASIAMRSLPRLRSTIAGAGGKTNESVRIAEEREQKRLKRLRDSAEEEQAQDERQLQYEMKVDKLKAFQEKNRRKRLKKKDRERASSTEDNDAD